jgi:cell wall assembly regulator SMI1
VEFVMTLRFAVHEVILAHTTKPWLEPTAPGRDALLLYCAIFEGLVPRSVLPYPSPTQQGTDSSPSREPLRVEAGTKSTLADGFTADQLVSSWRAIAKSVKARAGHAKRAAIGKPASEASVRRIEKEVGVSIPASFRDILRTIGSRAHFAWVLPDEPSDERAAFAHAAGFRPPTYGAISWDLSSLVRLDQERQGWADISSTRGALRTWRNKLPFHGLANGDLLAVDLSSGIVVYLDHDEGPMHGRRLGKSFATFVELFTNLGCPGPESWELEPFLGARGLTAKSTAATTWVSWLHGQRS